MWTTSVDVTCHSGCMLKFGFVTEQVCFPKKNATSVSAYTYSLNFKVSI